ncbi:MAG: A/G-specific adenine glycosylase [Bacteroidetes bacterium]|nr:A/G-specific adenine glycosylase [Bacteroidota bacterium]
MKNSTRFSTLLLDWNRNSNDRQMPWKGERDPYLVWLSEIILQQTRVEQGLPYFLRFKEAYPTLHDLADAPEDDVMRLWQGLGYYSRARNLHHTAKHIAYELKGEFPSTYHDIVKLKGIGPYTAAAISSFIFGERQAVVDGNVIRVLARVYGIELPFDTTDGRKHFSHLAQELISAEHPGEYNQAIMDFGATVCTPLNPKCEECPFSKVCVAYQKNLISELPVKSKKIVKKERYFYYLVLKNDKEIIISKRSGDDIWKGLYILPYIESDKPIRKNIAQRLSEYLGQKVSVAGYSKPYSQQLTHQSHQSVFIFVEGVDLQNVHIDGAMRVPLDKLSTFGFPKTVYLFLVENSLL